MPTNPSMVAAGASGLVGVAAGAFGAHALRDRLTARQQHAWSTAVQMNLIHTAGMLAVLALRNSVNPNSVVAKRLTHAFHLLFAGTTLFAGSIYSLCLGAPSRLMGPVTPIGGVTLMLGWITVALAGL